MKDIRGRAVTEEKRGSHKPFLYQAEGSRTAVLMVHGILGSPVQLEAAAKRLHERGFTVMGVLLPGHGGSAAEFAKAKRDGWRLEVRRAVLQLKQRYERVFIAGHSMGGLLAISEAAEQGADGLILIATPMRVKLSLRAITMSFKILLSDPNGDDDMLQSYRKAKSVQSGSFWTYCRWFPRFRDLRSMMSQTKRALEHVRCPVLTIQSRRDETVSWKSQRILADGFSSAPVEEMVLEKSRHSYFYADEADSMYERICRFVEDCSKAAV